MVLEWGRRCSRSCVDLADCWIGAVCYFGHCVQRECAIDSECPPDHECWQGIRCVGVLKCTSDATCPRPGYHPSYYCDLQAGRCEKGNCRDDSDCPSGTCGTDNWCIPDQCYGDRWPPCPPSLPVCHFSGDGSSACGLPCVRDSDCAPSQVCNYSKCQPPGNDCVFDSQCPPGQYCQPGCSIPPPQCGPEGACPEGSACSAGYCWRGADQNPACNEDDECKLWFEDGVCEHGRCQPWAECLFDADCAPGQICKATVCREPPSIVRCLSDVDCPAEMICESGPGDGCIPPPECTHSIQCGEGRACGSDRRCYPATGMCAWVEPGAGFCDDNDPATYDDCDPELGCVHFIADQR